MSKKYPPSSTICPRCGTEAMVFQDDKARFYKICLSCGAYSPRLCPHDGVVCGHNCENEDCWREVEGS